MNQAGYSLFACSLSPAPRSLASTQTNPEYIPSSNTHIISSQLMCSWEEICPSETLSPNITATHAEARHAASTTSSIVWTQHHSCLSNPYGSLVLFSNLHHLPLIPQELATHTDSCHTSNASRYVRLRSFCIPSCTPPQGHYFVSSSNIIFRRIILLI